MAEIPHTYVEQTTQQTHSGDTLWTDISGASIASANFTTGRKYLLVFMGELSGAVGAIARVGMRAVHGSTPFSEPEHFVEPQTTSSRLAYCYVTVWTAVASEGVKLQFKGNASGDTVRGGNLTLFSMEISEQLTENTDWFSDEVIASTALPNNWTSSNNASVTFTPSAGDDWLVITNALLLPGATNRRFKSRIERTGEASTTEPQAAQEGENLATDRFLFGLFRVFNNLGAVSQTFTEQSAQTGGGTNGTRERSFVFALNLNKFDKHASAFIDAEITLSATDFATEMQTISVTPNVVGDVWVVGSWGFEPRGSGLYCRGRQQIDGADQPPLQTTNKRQKNEPWDQFDVLLVQHQTVENLSAAAHTIDLDGSVESAVSGSTGEDRVLVAITMELAAAGETPVSQTAQSGYEGLGGLSPGEQKAFESLISVRREL